MNFNRPYNPTDHGSLADWQEATAPELERLATLPAYLLHVPTGASARSNRASHVCHTITTPEQLASFLPRKLAKNAEAIHGHVLACLGAGRESVTIQASPYFSASPEK